MTLQEKLSSLIKTLSDSNPEYKKYMDDSMGEKLFDAPVTTLSELLTDYRRFYSTDIRFETYFETALVVEDNMLTNKINVTAINPKDVDVAKLGFNEKAFVNTYVVFADKHDIDNVLSLLKARK